MRQPYRPLGFHLLDINPVTIPFRLRNTNYLSFQTISIGHVYLLEQ